ncbi:hypothetical protein [Tellurirhabdus rosea]|uniref:hypothetical protein n=1 Tax=Tellurirhabdus rosea TaxID=2674997 RepID=UPI002251F85F|nr:hypothetical protein [Tellurirhabdus rosea]
MNPYQTTHPPVFVLLKKIEETVSSWTPISETLIQTNRPADRKEWIHPAIISQLEQLFLPIHTQTTPPFSDFVRSSLSGFDINLHELYKDGYYLYHHLTISSSKLKSEIESHGLKIKEGWYRIPVSEFDLQNLEI